MKNVAPMHSAVKNSRNGIRPAAAVREGAEDRRHQGVDPDAERDRDRQSQRSVALAELASLVRYRPIAVETTMNEKIVLAKSYSAHEGGHDRPSTRGQTGQTAATPRPVDDRPRVAGRRIAGRGDGRHRPIVADGLRVGWRDDAAGAHADRPHDPAPTTLQQRAPRPRRATRSSSRCGSASGSSPASTTTAS